MSNLSKISQVFFKINGKIIFSCNNLIAIYTAFRILNLVKKNLGLEAMLEYLENSISYIESKKPDVAKITEQILKIVDMEKIYKEILENDYEDS